MSNALANLQARRHKTVVLRSGLKIGYHLPDIEECIVKVGTIPMAGLQAASNPSEAEVAAVLADQPEALAKGMEFRSLLIAAMLDDIDGEELTEDDDRGAIVRALAPEDRQELFLIASRQVDDAGEA